MCSAVKYEQFLVIYHRGPEELFKFFSTIVSTNTLLFEKFSLQEQLIKQQAEQIKLMEAELPALNMLFAGKCLKIMQEY